MDENRTIGLLIDLHYNQYGGEYVTVRVMQKDPDASHPLNITDAGFGPQTGLDDLVLDGWVSEWDGDFIISGPQYLGVSRVNARRAQAMAKILTKVEATIRKLEAHEPGDQFMAFAKVVGAEWVCTRRDRSQKATMLSNLDWSWMSVARGRDEYRDQIRQACEIQRELGLRSMKTEAA